MRVASTTMRPLWLMVAPMTCVPTVASTGRDSPVIMELSKVENPSITIPSVGILSPGFTTK